METLSLFNIQKFCINDGPGIRTTVFFKGCPLRCVWCHNPESKSVRQEIFYDTEKCIHCGRCVEVCEKGCHRIENGVHTFDRTTCVACGKCASVCMTEALEAVGKTSTTDEVLSEVMKDEAFYQNSGGGLTLSGGEPMLQYAGALELLQKAKKQGLHTCMETCGFADTEKYIEIAKFVDIFLFDYKLTDPVLHEKYTGVPNTKILENLKALDHQGAKIILRCPIIPTINDTEAHFKGIAATAEALTNILEIHIEPYHPLGSGKAARLGREYALESLSFPEKETVEEWIQTIQAQTRIPVKKA